ncbi:MAG: 30S ribosomal protein S24e [Candidatus Micrarchaeota archaeon]|nr:30S ribosomal protein S24e [Candidatus Micrarchaeota archaeon]
MKLEITNKSTNPFFNRMEVSFEVRHEAETPSRASVIKEIASALKADESLVVVEYIRQPFGKKMCYGKARVYKSEQDMKIEPKHLLARAAKSLGKGKESGAGEGSEAAAKK